MRIRIFLFPFRQKQKLSGRPAFIKKLISNLQAFWLVFDLINIKQWRINLYQIDYLSFVRKLVVTMASLVYARSDKELCFVGR